MKKRSVAIFLFAEVEVLDFSGPFEVFSVASQLHGYEPFEVFTVAREAEPVVAVNGLSVNPDYTLGQAPKADILILPGGTGTKKVVGEGSTMDWIAAAQRGSEITMSVCSGSRILGALGLLDGIEFTTHHEVFADMEEIAPEAIPRPGRRYVDNGRIMTSGGISAGIDLSFHVVEKLLGAEARDRTARYMEYRLLSS